MEAGVQREESRGRRSGWSAETRNKSKLSRTAADWDLLPK